MFSAHIDRHGLICTGPNEFQYAAFVSGSRSDLLGNSVSEELMMTIADRFEGVPVYAYEPWSGAYRGAGAISRASICEHRHNLIFEVKGLEHLVAGTPVALRDTLRIDQGCFVAQLDNVLSAAILVHLFEIGFQGTAFFTAQEEAGRSWRYLLEWFRRFGGSTNHLIVLDTSPYPTRLETDRQRVVLRRRDANAAFNEGLTHELEDLCHARHIAFSYKDRYLAEQNQALMAAGRPAKSLGSTEMGGSSQRPAASSTAPRCKFRPMAITRCRRRRRSPHARRSSACCAMWRGFSHGLLGSPDRRAQYTSGT